MITARTMPRPHGCAKYVVEKCRCDVCRRACAEYERWRTRQNAYGRPRYVDAQPAGDHARMLADYGIGWRRLARLSGVSTGAMSKLLYGGPGDRKPSERIRPATEHKILAVAPSLDLLGDGTPVPSIGTRRRLQALVTIGWSQSKLAARLDVTVANLNRLLHHQDQVAASTARAVANLYEQLWNTPPPHTGHHDLISYNRSRNYATKHGWAPPMAWDDDTLDDPDATPSGLPCRAAGCDGNARADGLCGACRGYATHCPRGHLYIVRHRPGRGRSVVCRTCDNDRRRARLATQEEAAA